MMRKERVIFIILVFVLIGLLAFSFSVFIKYDSGRGGISDNQVIEVIDGDTFKLYNGEIVRLICIDTPEKGSKGYDEAKEFLSSLVLDKEVRLEEDLEDKDVYGRSLRYVYAEEVFVNRELVQEGYASVFRYGNNTKRCGEIER